jgi:transcriptional regulator with XRE-family HTH domain
MKESTHTPEYAALRRELKAARQSAGLSQRELAARLDVAHTWVAKVESGERRIDFVEFIRFLAACGTDASAVSARLIRRIERSNGPSPSRGRRSK